MLSFDVTTTDCKKCAIGIPMDRHECRKNFSGSAKAMETHLAVKLINNNPILSQENVRISKIVGDGDSSTISAVRRSATDEITKLPDFNHTMKNFTSSLYNLKLPRSVIVYLSKLFAIAIKENKGNAPKIRSTLNSLVPHAFGEHNQCGEWCKANVNSVDSVDYEYNYLPGKKPLSDPELKLFLC